MMRSTDHFIAHNKDPRVLYEPGARVFADSVVVAMPQSIQKIENRQYRHFVEPVKVHVCASEESFYKLCGARVKAHVSNKLLLSPCIMNEPENIPLYLAHELSHLHLSQQLGLLNFRDLPTWFKEGLATFVSDGGGAQTVSEDEAISSILNGKHFMPVTGGFLGCFNQKSSADNALSHHMRYRQYMIFLSFIKNNDEENFKKFLLSIQDGNNLSESIQKVYHTTLDRLWRDFVQDINIQGKQKQC
ncbi:MAG: hypothetical protein KAR07_05485 [Spirochaetes bacterium]|nr:hypothetical protein [Spirochaetota bacterium]